MVRHLSQDSIDLISDRLNSLEYNTNQLAVIIKKWKSPQSKKVNPYRRVYLIPSMKIRTVYSRVTKLYREKALSSTAIQQAALIMIFKCMLFFPNYYRQISLVALIMQLINMIAFLITTAEVLLEFFRYHAISMFIYTKTYFSIVLVFAGIYTCIQLYDDQSFRGLLPSSAENALLLYLDLLYFSSVSLASVGFGDVCPTSMITRMLVMVEILLSVSFIDIAFGNPVSKQVTSFIKKEEPSTGTTDTRTVTG
eukprot:gnl/Dysnectes_brevis/4583_a6224_667.p1 GENE.gnl/Dysnectes_brevis/4583_a6224_667~~gnl/Dysnectes_brevis/4583_a6224_667.p1  ORF type:complete len:261 (-),score=-9.81 gnl/Dysnectes_brevis/4583_a6224_667:52-807(-)